MSSNELSAADEPVSSLSVDEVYFRFFFLLSPRNTSPIPLNNCLNTPGFCSLLSSRLGVLWLEDWPLPSSRLEGYRSIERYGPSAELCAAVLRSVAPPLDSSWTAAACLPFFLEVIVLRI